jgi:cell division protein FtsI/penicillin-binding protein 2
MEATLRNRIVLLVIAVALATVTIGFRLYQVQLVQSEELRQRARSQHETTVDIGGRRGAIVDRHGRELAVSVDTSSLYAHPHRFKDDDARGRAAKQVGKLLGLNRRELLKKLSSDRPFVWVRRRLDPETTEKLRALDVLAENAEAFGLQQEPKRFYPRGRLAVHVVGFSNIDQVGVEGVERQFNDILQGDSARYLASKDGLGGKLLQLIRPPRKQPEDLVLSIDASIQHIAERELDRAMRATRAHAASAVVLDPATGQLLALANRPTADPNRYGGSTPEGRRNRAVVDIYEPGSTFKIVTAAAVLERRLVSPDRRYDCENGSILVAGHRIGDHRPFGVLSFREIIENSSNIGMLKICRALRPAQFFETITSFGFGGRLGVELPGEREGLLRPVERWSALSAPSISFGQEIGVTALQMVSAFGTVANDGVMVPPRVVLGTRDADGSLSSFAAPEPRRIISGRAARTLVGMLEGVVERGTGNRARVGAYRLAGKTGTAQKAMPSGGYSPTDYVASFGGFGPLEEPRLAVFVMLDSPDGPIHQGGQVAAPVFRRILSDALTYLRVEPDRDLEPPRRRPVPSAHAPRAAGRLATPPGQVPDVRGLSLREAVSVLADRGYRAQVRGSGIVVTQSPAPGTRAEPATLCKIRLGERRAAAGSRP